MDPLTQAVATIVASLVKEALAAAFAELKDDGTAVQAHRDPDFNRRVGARIDEWLRGQGRVGGRDGSPPVG